MDSPRNSLLVQHAHDTGDRQPVGVRLEDPKHHGGLSWLHLHLVAVRSWAAFLIHPNRPDRHRPVPERPLADGEASLLLADLPPERLLLQVPELELVEDAADLDTEGGLLVIAVQPVGHRHHPHSLEMQLGNHREHEVVVAGEPREVVDQHYVELRVLGGGHQGHEPYPIAASPRFRLVGVDVVLQHGEAALGCEPPARTGLVLDALGALVLGAVPGVDGRTHA
ncbi:MAG: hypothetical protein WEG36_14255 [Gemmatimonadota bacterium]